MNVRPARPAAAHPDRLSQTYRPRISRLAVRPVSVIRFKRQPQSSIDADDQRILISGSRNAPHCPARSPLRGALCPK